MGEVVNKTDFASRDRRRLFNNRGRTGSSFQVQTKTFLKEWEAYHSDQNNFRNYLQELILQYHLNEISRKV